MSASTVRRSEIRTGDTAGVVFEPEDGSEHRAVFLGGSYGGIPEGPARKLAENGVSTFALGYFGAPGLPPGLVEIPLEMIQRGIDLFRDRSGDDETIGVVGFSKGAELALVLAAHLGADVGPVVAVAPSHAVWFGLKPPGPDPDRRSPKSSWSWQGERLPFLPCPPEIGPVFSERGLRTDAFFDMSRQDPRAEDAARIEVEKAMGPLLLLSGDDDHQWPAALMAKEIVGRMEDHGRGDDVTSVVYPGAGHAFFVAEFLPPPSSTPNPPYDLGGSIEADLAAGKDAWPRVIRFLKAPSRQEALGAPS